MKNGGIKLARLPLLSDVRELAIRVGFAPEFIACARGECFMASAEGNIVGFQIRAA
jgi:hypothetical protein